MTTLHRPALAACLLALAGASHAVTLVADGQWNAFDVDELSATSGGLEWIDLEAGGQPLSFDFTVAEGFRATLTVVDAGFAGDRFQVLNRGELLGNTGEATESYPDSLGLDFDAALADGRYSRGSFQLEAGSHRITGWLYSSVQLDGLPLNATVGGLRLDISPVPEPATLATLLAGLSLLTVVLRRRSN